MKTAKTASKNEAQNGQSLNRITPEAMDAFEKSISQRRETGKQRQTALKQQIDDTLEVVHCYDNHELGFFGFGFQSDGKLIQFFVPNSPDHCSETFDLSVFKEITMGEALAWMERFLAIDEMFGDPMQEREGFPRWIAALRKAIPAGF